MNAIECDFEMAGSQRLKDYEKFANHLLESLPRIFNSETVRRASSDVFWHFHVCFLMKFAIKGAQNNGELFTAPSLVQMIMDAE